MIQCGPSLGFMKSVAAMWKFCQAWRRSVLDQTSLRLYCCFAIYYSLIYFNLHIYLSSATVSVMWQSVTAMWRFCQAWQRSTPNWLVKFLKQHLYCYNYSIVYFALHVGGVRVHFMGTWIFGMFMKCVRVMPLMKFSNIVAMRRLMNLHIYLSSATVSVMWHHVSVQRTELSQ